MNKKLLTSCCLCSELKDIQSVNETVYCYLMCVVLLVGTALYLTLSSLVSSYLREVTVKPSVIPRKKSDRRERNCIACVHFSVCVGTLSA